MTSIKLDPDQQHAIDNFHSSPISIITGGPGTGKSTIVRNVLEILNSRTERYILCSPTGKAAQRLSAACDGYPAFTIHRMLGASPISLEWRYNSENKRKGYDWLICDESSMIDITLAYKLLQSFDPTTRILFVGDADQLPPVGPGSFFRDIISSNKFPVFRLKTNHRQGAGSTIAENALRINQGVLSLAGKVWGNNGNDAMDIDISNEDKDDFHFVLSSDPIDMRMKMESILAALKSRYPNNFTEKVQVLSPQKGTKVGVFELNKYIRHYVNPYARAYEPFSVGDKVMQMRNDYKIGLMNGDVGKVTHVDKSDYIIDFSAINKGNIIYPRRFKSMYNASGTNMALCYCATVHKFQGSECEAGVLIVSTAHKWMLRRNLLYTGITRFKKLCILLCDKPALRKAIVDNKDRDRYTKLVDRILAGNGTSSPSGYGYGDIVV